MNKYNPIPICDDDLCHNPATVTTLVYFITSSGNRTQRTFRLCPACAALLHNVESAPLPHGIPTPYRTQARGSRYA